MTIQKIKDEILTKISENESKGEKLAFIAGIVRGGGLLNLSKQGIGLIVKSENLALLNKCRIILEDEFQIEVDVEQRKGNRIRNVNEFRISMEPKDAKKLLIKTEVMSQNFFLSYDVPNMIKVSVKRRNAYLKGLFLICGTMIIPSITEESDVINYKSKAGYHLELSLTAEDFAKNLEAFFNNSEMPFMFIERRKKYVLYIKDSEKIGDFLVILGCTDTYFYLQDIVSRRMMRNRINRQRNCELGNIEKMVSANTKQLNAINYLESTGTLKKLDAKLQSAANLRIENPDATLAELATLSGESTKSGFMHRFNKLIEIYNKEIENA